MRYGVIALGDRTYLQTFCFGGKRFDERLQGLGAQRIGEVWCHDASAGTMPEELAPRGAATWLEQGASGRRRMATARPRTYAWPRADPRSPPAC